MQEGSSKKSVKVTFIVHEDLYDKIKAKADKNHLAVSAFIRQIVADKVEK